ncbi:hypothetical protein Cgig2_034113 [Carnegiea gigantea]|uniref:MLO-like protein n=1 Tax=Carnegiea gigantea TaxID=171969 RepID=A0A9Q1K355_9CARY|nr:hypothetical protein Cgig2_034113 [Carnegiea gigantea]
MHGLQLMWGRCFVIPALQDEGRETLRQFNWLAGRARGVVAGEVEGLLHGLLQRSNHHLTMKYDFHSYMIRSMEEEFQSIVGVSGPLWGFVIAFMLCNVKGSNLYFWIAIMPIALVLLVGAKLQHVIATLTVESAGMSGFFTGTKLKPRDDLFWFKRPELLLSLIHFILFQVRNCYMHDRFSSTVHVWSYFSATDICIFLPFVPLQNSFELASFFWFWWQFGYYSCFIKNHHLVFLRLIMGFLGQFLCSYSTLPLYALVTQKRYQLRLGVPILLEQWPDKTRPRKPHFSLVNVGWVRMPRYGYVGQFRSFRMRLDYSGETIHGWKKSAAKRKRRLGIYGDDATIHTDTSTVMSLEEDDHHMLDIPESRPVMHSEIELQSPPPVEASPPAANEDSSRVGTPLLRPSAFGSFSVAHAPLPYVPEAEGSSLVGSGLAR